MPKKAVRRIVKKKRNLLLPSIVLTCVIVIAIAGAVVFISRQASDKCLRDGGQERAIGQLFGQKTLCLFPDGTVCDETAYLSGSCAKGICKRTCMNIGTSVMGWYDCNTKLLFLDNCTSENPITAGSC